MTPRATVEALHWHATLQAASPEGAEEQLARAASDTWARIAEGTEGDQLAVSEESEMHLRAGPWEPEERGCVCGILGLWESWARGFTRSFPGGRRKCARSRSPDRRVARSCTYSRDLGGGSSQRRGHRVGHWDVRRRRRSHVYHYAWHGELGSRRWEREKALPIFGPLVGTKVCLAWGATSTPGPFPCFEDCAKARAKHHQFVKSCWSTCSADPSN